jgi:phage gp46-like protein
MNGDSFPELDIRLATECLDVAPLMDTIMVATNPTTGELVCRGEWWMADTVKEPNNVGGIQAEQALLTSIALQLFTDRFSSSPTFHARSDPRGWWGDGIDRQGQPPLGSTLWTYLNGTLDAQIAFSARNATIEALQPLLTKNQGPVASFNVVAIADQANSRLDIQISGYSEDGSTIYSQKWSFAWAQTLNWSQPYPSFTFTP